MLNSLSNKNLTETLKDSVTPNEEAYEAHKRLLERAAQLDLEVTGMSREWFLPEGCRQRKGHAMPRRDLTEGSLYMQALHMNDAKPATGGMTRKSVTASTV